ncbi:MAG TPA: ARMT1-like domain-containing protein [Prolixibacteraceae bacterium]|nr:ARMT1-like domain-containing protein [Prolixibacteraceae bacterium]
MRRECYHCHSKTIEQIISKHNPPVNKAEEFQKNVENYIQHNWNLQNPVIATHIHRLGRDLLNNKDLYRKEKREANKLLLNNYDYWKAKVTTSNNPFHTAAKLAVIGNIIDYGAHAVPEKIEEFIEEMLLKPLAIDDAVILGEKARKANFILYLGDNAGEIVFDKLFIETMQHTNVTFAVRDEAVINDVTRNEARQVEMNKLCKIISNGYDAPSTLLEHCSPGFLKTYENADLIISKGQGNFEGLMNEKRNDLFFLFMAKCQPIAEMVGVKSGSMLIKQNKKS